VQQFNKTTSAVVAGAIVTILVALLKVYGGPLSTMMDQPGVQAALQTVITAAAVYFGPANQPA
jgi:hypothetical protein